MSEITPYKLDVTSANANQGIKTGLAVAQTPGIILSDGQGGVKSAVPGTDYGMPMLFGNGAPTASTVGSLGQHYFDTLATAAPYEYICVGYTAAGFVWMVYGDSGTNFAPRGHFISLDALEAAVEAGTIPEPTPGVAYYIGAETPYDVYIWDAVTEAWTNTGPLVGNSGGTTTGIPPHGNEGQALLKLSDADYDVVWGDIELEDGQVDAAAIAAGAVTDPKIADGAVTAPKIANSAVTNAKIADGAVSTVYTATLDTTWSGSAAPYTKAQTISGILATDKPIIDLVPSATFADAEAQEEAWANIYRAVTSANTITFYAKDKPTVSIPIQVRCIRK